MKHEFVADFETTQIKVYKEERTIYDCNLRQIDRAKSRAFVCAWGLADIAATTPEEVDTGRTIESFIERLKAVAAALPKGSGLTVFTHNLSFDGAFIMWYILTQTKYKKRDEVRDDASLYSFVIDFDDIGRSVTFRDSNKIFPQSVAELGELYGVRKLRGAWDYNKYRDESTEISEDEWAYVKNDVLIVCRALADYRARGFTQNTLASIAYNQRLRFTFPAFKKSIATSSRIRGHNYRACYPFEIAPLSKPDALSLIPSYLGGWTWLNPAFYGKPIPSVFFYDQNSGYPDKMANGVLPIGAPQRFDYPSEKQLRQIERLYPCCVYVLDDFSIELKTADALPVAMFPTQEDGAIRCQGKVIRCKEEHVVVTGIDLEMIKAEYNVAPYVVSHVYAFSGRRGIYKKYVEHWMAIKERATTERDDAKEKGDEEKARVATQEREIAKNMINRPYGKDGSKIMRESRETVIKDGVIAYESKKDFPPLEYYLPSAIFITALQRRDTYDAAKAAGGEFIYSDTDSAATTDAGRALIESAIKIDDSALGAWKIEKEGTDARFIRQKTYGYKDNDGLRYYVISGANMAIKSVIDWNEFRPGMRVSLEQLHKYKDADGMMLQGRLRPVAVNGGVILDEGPFEINERETWDESEGRNVPVSLYYDTFEKMKAGVI